MKSLIAYFIKYPIMGNLLTIVLLIFGAMAMMNTKSTFFPDTPSKRINIQIVYPGASPEEIEEGIVAKIEDNLKGIAGLDQVRSASSENAASIIVTVLNPKETDIKLQDVKNAVDRISSFPVGMEPPVIYKQEALGFAISFAITGDLPLTELKRRARIVEEDLRSEDNISQVSLTGFPDEEIEIEISEDKLLALNLQVSDVAQAVQRANIETTGGKIKGEFEELILRTRSKKYFAREMESFVVKALPDGRIIRLRDVATVRDQWSEDNPQRNWFNNSPAVIVTVNNLIEEDMIGIVKTVRTYIDDYNGKGADAKIEVIRDNSIILNQRIELLRNNGVIGFGLVVIILALFLNIRLAFWVALAIPVSFAGMFVVGTFVPITLNVISLFGMILVIGILVDDGIVIAENIYRHYERGKSRKQATIDNTNEVLPAVFSAIATTVVAFSTFFYIDGRLGEVFMEMAIVVIFTLVFSLVEGALILPPHVGHSHALSRNLKANKVERTMRKFMDFLKMKAYAPVLKFALRQPWITFSLIVFLFSIVVSGAIGGGFVKTTFFPDIAADNLVVNLKMAAGTRENITKNQIDEIEEAIWQVNQDFKKEREDTLDVVLAVNKQLGPGSFQASFNISLLNGETRMLGDKVIADSIRKKVGPIYGADLFSIGAGGPFGEAVSISLLGRDMEQLQGATDFLKAELEQMPDLKDVRDNNQKGLKEVNITLKEKARFLGLSEGEVLSQVRQGYFGNEAQRIQRGVDEVKIWVRLTDEDRFSVGKLKKLRIRTLQGGLIPLDELADFEIERGVVAINRLYNKREIQVSAGVANAKVSVSDATAQVKEKIITRLEEKFPEVRVAYEGQQREQVKSQKSMQGILPIILMCMLLVIAVTFRSVFQALALMLLLPFGLIGVVFGHWFEGFSISLFSWLGVVALVGVLVNDALVFVSAFNNNLKEGMSFNVAIYKAGLSRFRPIILTSLTTIAGLYPLILDNSFQAQFLIPMAISVAYGLLFVTLIILVLLPIYLTALNSLRVYAQWLWVGKKPTREEIEPALREISSFKHFSED